MIKLKITGGSLLRKSGGCLLRTSGGSLVRSSGGCYTGFSTMEGHVEKGVILFTLSKNKAGDLQFTIHSKSEVDFGMVSNKYARGEQKKSWEEVLTNVVKKLGGKESERKEVITDPKTK